MEAINKRIEKLLKKLDSDIDTRLSGIPQNEKIKQVATGCFTMAFSDISGGVLASQYYDFKHVVGEIKKDLEKSRDKYKFMKAIVDTGKFDGVLINPELHKLIKVAFDESE